MQIWVRLMLERRFLGYWPAVADPFCLNGRMDRARRSIGGKTLEEEAAADGCTGRRWEREEGILCGAEGDCCVSWERVVGS
jgi:hypothetical protein